MGLDDIRVNNAGCLERCELGPTMVVYPEGVWYHYENTADVDEILDSHILHDQPVVRLLLPDGLKYPDIVPPARLNLIVSELTRSEVDLLRIELKHSEGKHLPPFTAGAHINLLIDNDRIRRSYSLINNPEEEDGYLIAVRKSDRADSGAIWIFNNLKTGDIIQARHPENTFCLNESAEQHVLVGQGVGAAPFLSMSHRLRATGARFHAHYVSESTDSNVLLSDLEAICGPNLTHHRSEIDSTISASLAKVLKSTSAGSHLYLCGSGHFVTEARNLASDWPIDAISVQYFSAPESTPVIARKFGVSLARRQKTLQVSEDESLLDVLRKAGMPIDYACENGACGVCKVKVLYGEVEHRDCVLTEAEKLNQDAMITCVSRAAGEGSRLVLDI